MSSLLSETGLMKEKKEQVEEEEEEEKVLVVRQQESDEKEEEELVEERMDDSVVLKKTEDDDGCDGSDESVFDVRGWINSVLKKYIPMLEEGDLEYWTTHYYCVFIENQMSKVDDFFAFLPHLDRDLLFKMGVHKIRHLVIFDQAIQQLKQEQHQSDVLNHESKQEESSLSLSSHKATMDDEYVFENKLSIDEARSMMAQFASERDWNQFHTPRNILIALVGEIGELCELFQWKGEVDRGVPQLSKESERVNLEDELADVLAYLVRLSDICHVDLAQAFANKMRKNEKKYPVDLVKGSSKKYTEYQKK